MRKLNEKGENRLVFAILIEFVFHSIMIKFFGIFSFGAAFSHYFCGDTRYYREVGDIFRYDTAGSRNAAFADGYAGKDSACGINFCVFADYDGFVGAYHVVAFGMSVGEYLAVFGNHRIVFERYAAFTVDITAMVPGHVVADFDKMSVVETATFVCDKAFSATLEEFFRYHSAERYGKVYIYSDRNSVDYFPKNMVVTLLFGVRKFVRAGHGVAPQSERADIIFVKTVRADKFHHFQHVFCVESFVEKDLYFR